MDIYIDLSILTHLTLIFFTYRYLLFFFQKPQKSYLFFLINIISAISLIFDINYLTPLMLISSIVVLYRKKAIKPILITITVYYIFLFSLSGLNNNIVVFYLMPAITSPAAVLTIFILPAIYLLIIFSAFIGQRLLKFKKLVFFCRLFIDEQKLIIKGYLDTGNRLLVGGLPVVFLSNKITLCNKGMKFDYQSVNGRCESYGLVAELEFKGARKKVIVATSNQQQFHGCQALLSAYLI